MTRQQLVTTIQRKSWADMFYVGGAAYYGNGIVTEIRSTSGSDSNSATGRLGTGVNVTLGVKLSGSDFTSRRDKVQVQQLQLDRLQSDRQLIEQQLRDAVATQYFPLENVLQTVRLRAETLETLRLTRTVAENTFRKGTCR